MKVVAPKRVPPGQAQVALFRRRLHDTTPHVFVTYGLVAICVGVWLVQVAGGIDAWDPSPMALLAAGANSAAYVEQGQWYRLVTSLFLHGGILHLGFNMWVLWVAGPLIERFFGNLGFFILYMVAGVGGSLASVMFSLHPNAVSIGASGAIFGLFGGLLAFVLLQRRAVPRGVLRGLRSSVVAFIGYNLLFGFIVPVVDNSAHIGGLVTGFLGGLVLSRPLTAEAKRTRWLRDLALLLLGGAGLGAVAHLIGAV